MITVNNLGMQFGGQWLFQHVDLQFLPGNCYGIIGANGAGKSTFLRILTGELESTTGSINVDPDKRVSVLKQNQNAYDEYTVLDTVIMGNQHLYDVMKEKDAIYEKEDFSDEDGIRASELEGEINIRHFTNFSFNFLLIISKNMVLLKCMSMRLQALQTGKKLR